MHSCNVSHELSAHEKQEIFNILIVIHKYIHSCTLVFIVADSDDLQSEFRVDFLNFLFLNRTLIVLQGLFLNSTIGSASD